MFENVTVHGGIFLSGYARQEASGVRPMWKTGQKQSYKRAPRLFLSSFPRPVNCYHKITKRDTLRISPQSVSLSLT